MSDPKDFQRISQAPTHPSPTKNNASFDVASLYGEAPVLETSDGSAEEGYDEKLRQAYFWVTNRAIISPSMI